MENTGAISGVKAHEWGNAGKIKLQAGLEQIRRPGEYYPSGEDYVFHKEGCPLSSATPEKTQEFFARKGKSSSGSIRWQCKQCLKLTNVKPHNVNSFSYNQKKSGIMFRLYCEILQDRSVTDICSRLRINPKTYYHKLSLLADRLQRLKSQLEQKNRELFTGRELFLASDLYRWEHKGKKSALALTVEANTGYVARADYVMSLCSWKVFNEEILPAHLYLIQERFRPGLIRQAPTGDCPGELEKAWDQLGAGFRWSSPGKAQPSDFMEAAGYRLNGTSGKYTSFYLDVYSYAYSLTPEHLEGRACKDILVEGGGDLEKTLSDRQPG